MAQITVAMHAPLRDMGMYVVQGEIHWVTNCSRVVHKGIIDRLKLEDIPKFLATTFEGGDGRGYIDILGRFELYSWVNRVLKPILALLLEHGIDVDVDVDEE
jgi:hypothetical protein